LFTKNHLAENKHIKKSIPAKNNLKSTFHQEKPYKSD